MPRSVDKLQGLHDEFDFANTAAPKFHVAFQLVLADDVAFNTPLDTGNFVQQIGRGALGINERLMLPQEFVSQLAAAPDSTCLDQRKTFPGLGEPYCCRNSVFQCSNTLRMQISATCESSPVVSSSGATFASSRTAMRVISRAFQRRRAEKP